MEYKFRVVSIPKAQPRVKARSMYGHATVYTPETADDWKRAVMIAANGLSGVRLEEPLSLEIVFYLKAPKKKHGSFVTSKPDIDNLIKSTMDALTSIELWKDDSYVVSVSAVKLYETPLESCGAAITITRAEWYLTTAKNSV